MLDWKESTEAPSQICGCVAELQIYSQKCTELQIYSQKCTTVCWIGKNQQKLRHRFVAVWHLQPEVYHSMLDWKESTEAPSQICGCVASTTRSVPQYAGLERINRSSVTDLWLWHLQPEVYHSMLDWKESTEAPSQICGCGIYNQKCTTVCWIGKNQQKLRHRFVAVASTTRSVPQYAGSTPCRQIRVAVCWVD